MIYIFAPVSEKSVNIVISYLLLQRKTSWCRSEINPFLEIQNKITTNNLFTSFWYRKGRIVYSNTAQIEILKTYLSSEHFIASDFIIHQLEQKPHIGNYFQRFPNKLWHLEMARQAGLGVPDMLITTQKIEAQEFIKKYSSVINKSIKDSFTGTFEGVYYYNHTERVSTEVVEELDEEFFPTLFQEEIPKEYELRVIFVHEKMWAGAIMSQSDPKTSLDWRNYNHQKPNRIVPYKLPSEVEEKIRKFAQLADLNTGAIDMIVSKDKRYVFLECNPNGQISMVSEKCNYPIEKYIADFLANA
ncbi:grasp-with-spasm system ATP-grasp peptide maturase [Runella limosa]|uniref:grasp-with-spasm system ATP-grasp peptide maturase n=1 Tax=Runella limosa TaxID=370978 RepID=UPI00048B0358|nr:grasp-with-spasm system ATP-grasp peptide maturase [Runella limosa]